MAKPSAYRIGAELTQGLVVTTGNEVDGYRIAEYLGIVRGLVVRSPTLGQGFMGSLKSLGGGNIAEFSEVCELARHEAYGLMHAHATALGAHAVIGMRYDATEFSQGITEVLAYGTAVRIVAKT